MNSMELKNRLDHLLAESFGQTVVNSKSYYIRPDGVVFAICLLPKDKAFVVEYADSIEDANLFRFEDGDLFYYEEMDEDTLLRSIISEING